MTNPFTKLAETSVTQLVEKARSNINSASANLPDPLAQQQEYLDRIQENADKQRAEQEKAIKEQESRVKAQQAEQKQQEMTEQKEIKDNQMAATNLSRAAYTPSYKNYVIKAAAIKRARSVPRWAKSLFGTRAQNFAGATLPTVAWDQQFFGEEPITTAIPGIGADVNTDRLINLGVGLTTGTYSMNRVRAAQRIKNQLQADLAKLRKDLPTLSGTKLQRAEAGIKDLSGQIDEAAGRMGRWGSVAAIGPGIKTPIISLFGGIPDLVHSGRTILKEKANQLQNGGTTGASTVINNTTSESNIPWKTILGLSAVGMGGLALNEWYKNKLKKEEIKAREALAKSNKAPARNKATDRVALEIPAHKISDNLYTHLGREILFKDKKEDERATKKAANAGALNYIADTVAGAPSGNTTLTPEMAKQDLNDAAYIKWYQDRHRGNLGTLGTVSEILPHFAGFLGIRMSTPGQRYAQHLTQLPDRPPRADTQSSVTEALAKYKNPFTGRRWTPGKELTLGTV